jgi:hypothetical protein
MAKKISYLSRNFSDYQQQLQSFTSLYYPDVMSDFQDASIGQWLIDLQAAVADDLSFYIDRMFQETQIDYAQLTKSKLSIARTKGLKISGAKASVVEVEWSCYVPIGINNIPDINYLPLIKKGSQVSGGNQIFELTSNLDFSLQFNSDSVSDRQIIPNRNSNGDLISYLVKKVCVMTAGTTSIYTRILTDSDIVPFMSIILPDPNVLSIESIIFKEGNNLSYTPTSSDFAMEGEYLQYGSDNNPVWRYYEVNSLLEDKIFGDVFSSDAYPVPVISTDVIDSGSTNCPQYNSNVSIVKGQWIPIRQKFITEYTDKGYKKIIFGASADYDTNVNMSTAYGQYQLSRLINNENMGILPKSGWTMYVEYRVGGGISANVGIGAISTISYLDADIVGDGAVNSQATVSTVKSTLQVRNTTASVGGKDAPSDDELTYMIKYNNGAQDRCVTLKDYEDRIYKMPPRYGAPFRISLIEQNNIIFVNMLSIDENGLLTKNISQTLMTNISNYVSEYRNLSDYIIYQAGKIINLQFEIDVMLNKSFNKSDVIKNIITTIQTFMNINSHKMGEDIYISDLHNELLQIQGLLNLIDLRVYNVYNGIYSTDIILQTTIVNTTNRDMIDLSSSNGILYSEIDSMFEINNASIDIKVRAITN